MGTEPANDFDWASDEDIVLHEQQAIAIYFNKYQGLVIRQERGRYEDQDTIIIINRENIDAVLGRLTAVAGRK